MLDILFAKSVLEEIKFQHVLIAYNLINLRFVILD